MASRKTAQVWVAFTRTLVAGDWSRWYAIAASVLRAELKLDDWREPGRQIRVVRVSVPVPPRRRGGSHE